MFSDDPVKECNGQIAARDRLFDRIPEEVNDIAFAALSDRPAFSTLGNPTDREAELAIVRQAYARRVLLMAGVTDPRLCAAFAQVRREDFLGPGPRQILRAFGGYATMPDASPLASVWNSLRRL